MRANQCHRLATETEEERAARLQWISANQCHRLPSETEEERAPRLQRMSANQCHRLATETEEERAARLQRMRDRLASETEEERAARLQQMSANQHHRLAAETGSERPDYSITGKGKKDNSHSCLCLNSPLFRLFHISSSTWFRPHHPSSADFFFWTRFDNLVAKTTKK